MRRRPQTNRSRGLLRAAAAVILLVVLLIVVVIVASTLTAPPVRAPVVPPTPGPITPVATPGTARPTTPVTRPRPTPRTTATPKPKKLGLAPLSLDQRASQTAFLRALSGRPNARISAVAGPGGRSIAFFPRAEPVNGRVPLLMSDGRAIVHIGFGDPLVRPVWSPDGRHIMFVRVRSTAGIPGARWQLIEWDRGDGSLHRLAAVDALGMTPLGWSRGRALYLVSQPTELSLFAAGHERHTLLANILSQPISSASLSPGGRYIALAAPDNCGSCTLDVYDLGRSRLESGPTGLPNSSTIAWTGDGSSVVVEAGTRLEALRTADLSLQSVAPAVGIPERWQDVMRAEVRGHALELVDTITHRIYRSDGTSG